MDPPRSSSSTATEKDVGVTNTEAAAVGDVPTTTDGPVNAGAGAAEDSNTDLSNNDDGTPPDRPAVVPFADAAAAATQNAIFMSSVVVRVEEENATSNVLEADQQQEQQREEGRNKEHAPTATATEPCTSTPTTGLEEEEEVTPLAGSADASQVGEIATTTTTTATTTAIAVAAAAATAMTMIEEQEQQQQQQHEQHQQQLRQVKQERLQEQRPEQPQVVKVETSATHPQAATTMATLAPSTFNVMGSQPYNGTTSTTAVSVALPSTTTASTPPMMVAAAAAGATGTTPAPTNKEVDVSCFPYPVNLGKDVISGKGGKVQQVNRHFRDLVAAEYPMYDSTSSKISKRKIGLAIYQTVIDSGGKFLDHNGEAMDQPKAVLKVMKALKDAKTWTSDAKRVAKRRREELVSRNSNDGGEGTHRKDTGATWQGHQQQEENRAESTEGSNKQARTGSEQLDNVVASSVNNGEAAVATTVTTAAAEATTTTTAAAEASTTTTAAAEATTTTSEGTEGDKEGENGSGLALLYQAMDEDKIVQVTNL